MAIIGTDTFIRADQSGWGTASDGQTWAQLRGTQTLAIATNTGKMTFVNSTTGIMALGTNTSADAEGLVRFQVSTLTDLAGIALRVIDSNNFYSCVVGNTSQTITFRRDLTSTFTTIGTAVSFTYSTGTLYWMRFRIVGSTLSAKIWADGSAEPGAWTMTATDSGITAAGRFGIVGTPTTTANTCQFDSFSANDTVVAAPSTYPRFIPRGFGATIIPTIVSQPLPYIDRGLLSTIVYENRTFVPRALSGVYIPDNVMWVPRAFGSTIQPALLRSLTLAGVGTLTETLSLATALTDTIPGVGTLTGTLSANTALAVTLPGVGTLNGTFSLATALTCTFVGVGTLTGTLSTTGGVSLSVTMAGVGTLTGTFSLATALSTTLVGVGTLSGTLSARTALATTVVGVGTLTGQAAFSTALSSSLIGVGTLSGVFTIRVALSLTFAGMGTLAGTLSIPSLSYLTAICITRDMMAVARTRDMQTGARTRDMQAIAKTRDEQVLALTRDEQATARTRS